MKNSYVVTMLGTDTKYSSSSSEELSEIKQTELLGFISDQIQTDASHSDRIFNPFAQKHPNSNIEPYNKLKRLINQKVTVIDGPDKIGSYVNKIIAMGVHEILRALFAGNDEINLIAHSRGAVESIIIAHEIERIQQLIEQENPETPQAFNDAYKKQSINPSDSKQTAKTKLIIQNLLSSLIQDNLSSSQIEQRQFLKFKDKLKKVRINIFAIDPVPGGEYNGPLSGFWWHDHERYLRVPKIVKQYTQILLENDHSSCFRAIVPKPIGVETEFKVINLLGAHGTASGNPLLHDGRFPDSNNKDAVRDCQYLSMSYLIDFLVKNGMLFTRCDNSDIFLHTEFNKYISADEDHLREQLKLEYYQRMIQNISAYLTLTTTSYVGMCEAVVTRWFNSLWNFFGIILPSPSRYMYQLDEREVFTEDSVAINDVYGEYIVKNRQIVNQEHALLLIGLTCLYEKELDTLIPSLKLQLLRSILEKNLHHNDIDLRVKAFRLNQKHDCEKKLMELIIQVKSEINDLNEDDDFSAITQAIEKILTKPVDDFNPIEWFVLDKLLDVYMGIKERQLSEFSGFEDFKKTVEAFITNRKNGQNNEILEESRAILIQALTKISILSLPSVTDEQLKNKPHCLFNYRNSSILLGVNGIAMLAIALFAPIINPLPLFITAGILLTISTICLMLEKYQVETVDKQALFPR